MKYFRDKNASKTTIYVVADDFKMYRGVQFKKWHKLGDWEYDYLKNPEQCEEIPEDEVFLEFI